MRVVTERRKSGKEFIDENLSLKVLVGNLLTSKRSKILSMEGQEEISWTIYKNK